jgi:hypothetical protein
VILSPAAFVLRNKIIEIISLPEYQPGKKRPDGTPITYCNEAWERIARELGFDTSVLLEIQGIGWTGATKICDNAAALAKVGKIWEISPRQAQLFANLYGIPVLAAARRLIDDNLHSSHVGTVAPDDSPWNPAAGDWIGQAGAENGFRSSYDSFIKWGLASPHLYVLPLKAA